MLEQKWVVRWKGLGIGYCSKVSPCRGSLAWKKKGWISYTLNIKRIKIDKILKHYLWKVEFFFYAIESNGGIKKTMNPKSANKAGNFFFLKVQLWIILRFCTQAAFMFKRTDSNKKKGRNLCMNYLFLKIYWKAFKISC